jgi:hypothetical protein
MIVPTCPLPPGYLWWLAAGFLVWCSALVSVYAVHAIGCTFAWSAGSLRLGLALVLFAHLAVIGSMWHRLGGADQIRDFGQTGAFFHIAAVWATIAAFATTIFTLGATTLLNVCV